MAAGTDLCFGLPCFNGAGVVDLQCRKKPWQWPIWAAAAAMLPTLAACGVADDRMAMAFVDPAAYRYTTCPQLDIEARNVERRRLQLASLIERAERGAAGTFVSAAVYRSDYLSAVGRLRLIERAQTDKNCGKVTLPQPEPVAANEPADPADPAETLGMPKWGQ